MDPGEGAFGGEWEYSYHQDAYQVQQQQAFETQPLVFYPGLMVTYSPVFFLPAQVPYTGGNHLPMYQPLGMFPTPEMGQSEVNMQQPPEPAVDPVGLSLLEDDDAILVVGQVLAGSRLEGMETEQETFRADQQLPQQQQSESRGPVRSRRHRRKGFCPQNTVRSHEGNHVAERDEGRVAESGEVPQGSSNLEDKIPDNLDHLRKIDPKEEDETVATGRKEASNRPFCKLCKSNKETRSFYMGHVLRDENGIVQCPVLRELVCSFCGATQDNAHTARYCPQLMKCNKEEDLPSTSGNCVIVKKDDVGPEIRKETVEDQTKANEEICVHGSSRTAAGHYTMIKF